MKRRTTVTVNRIISEVAGTIATNGIQELSHEERGGISEYDYVHNCLVSTAYNASRTMHDLSYGEFWDRVEREMKQILRHSA
jgi:hypothetical protein